MDRTGQAASTPFAASPSCRCNKNQPQRIMIAGWNVDA
jgi:hypothetical protein